ncbi:ABC transporter substrate-binding protein [Tsukamurella sp. 8F]|uniref:ABC transporter substrate-binding protein n=1 Tax=unclassified Tsukamurella TaxID=2633480 RepID=UPI0023B904AB|nr:MULTISPECIES: ABC transporter substrate-binding protein [unclassified Tsukamurella]MDF0529626.1 ABC transporter substrate-binding protein [Tsukamurella sp. 8J]MDF0585911.1 ABC transporter substrate-binding protein [Tsukamurella sp. 8F]
MPVEPRAALGMYPTDTDLLVTLGFKVARSLPTRDGKAFPSYYPQAELTGIETFANFPEHAYEKIAAAKPDFILDSLGYENGTHNKLEGIAPTYTYNGFDDTPWREHFKTVAAALGRTAQYNAWVARYGKRLAEVKAKVGSKVEGKTIAPIVYNNGKFLSACLSYATCSTMRDLGATIYAGAYANGGHGETLSAEQLTRLGQVDLFIAASNPATNLPTVSQVANDPSWTSLKAVTNGQVMPVSRELAFGSPSGQLELLNVIEKWLSAH